MKNYRKVISVIAVLIGLFVMSVSVSAADLAIIVVDGKAVVGNGTSGVAIVASYDEDGKLTKVVKEYVTESSSTVLNVKNGDKVMSFRTKIKKPYMRRRSIKHFVRLSVKIRARI